MRPARAARAAGYVLAACLIVGLVFSAFGVPRAAAQSEQPSPTPVISDDQVNAIARDMYCPICDNIPLDVCPTAACAEWREQIRTKLAEGWDRKQIEEFFALRFSDRVLSLPPARGLNLLLYIGPALILLAGIAAVYFTVKKLLKKPSAGGQTAEPAREDEYIRRVEEELRRREREK